MARNVKQLIEQANAKALSIMTEAQPKWVDVLPASEFIPDFAENLILHAGPPIEPDQASPPVRNAISGAAVHQRLAATQDEAWRMVEKAEIKIGSLLDRQSAGGAAFAVAANTPLHIIEDQITGTKSACAIQEGASTEALRWGIYTPAVEERLEWIDKVLAPVLRDAVRSSQGINLKNIVAKAASMGDENHSRQAASTLLLYQHLIPSILDLDIDRSTLNDVVKFLYSAERFFLHVFIGCASSVMQAVKGIDYCTLLVAIGANGTEMGIKVAATGDRWFTTAAPRLKGMLLNPNWTDDMVGLCLGESCMVECYGFGGVSAAAAPAVTRLFGGGLTDAMKQTEDYRNICVGAHDWAPIPWADFQGPPAGIDMRKVVSLSQPPIVHGGSALITGGQAGAGATALPIELFHEALRAFAEKYDV